MIRENIRNMIKFHEWIQLFLKSVCEMNLAGWGQRPVVHNVYLRFTQTLRMVYLIRNRKNTLQEYNGSKMETLLNGDALDDSWSQFLSLRFVWSDEGFLICSAQKQEPWTTALTSSTSYKLELKCISIPVFGSHCKIVYICIHNSSKCILNAPIIWL